jgi:hypothetical protein
MPRSGFTEGSLALREVNASNSRRRREPSWTSLQTFSAQRVCAIAGADSGNPPHHAQVPPIRQVHSHRSRQRQNRDCCNTAQAATADLLAVSWPTALQVALRKVLRQRRSEPVPHGGSHRSAGVRTTAPATLRGCRSGCTQVPALNHSRVEPAVTNPARSRSPRKSRQRDARRDDGDLGRLKAARLVCRQLNGIRPGEGGVHQLAAVAHAGRPSRTPRRASRS